MSPTRTTYTRRLFSRQSFPWTSSFCVHGTPKTEEDSQNRGLDPSSTKKNRVVTGSSTRDGVFKNGKVSTRRTSG